MTLLQRFSQFLLRNVASTGPPAPSTGPAAIAVEKSAMQPEVESAMAVLPHSQPADLPDWLLDEDSLRDEGFFSGFPIGFPGEFGLARGLCERLTEQQRNLMMNFRPTGIIHHHPARAALSSLGRPATRSSLIWNQQTIPTFSMVMPVA